VKYKKGMIIKYQDGEYARPYTLLILRVSKHGIEVINLNGGFPKLATLTTIAKEHCTIVSEALCDV
jgi:hypothetical protein